MTKCIITGQALQFISDDDIYILMENGNSERTTQPANTSPPAPPIADRPTKLMVLSSTIEHAKIRLLYLPHAHAFQSG
jgi:hypothetical protein